MDPTAALTKRVAELEAELQKRDQALAELALREEQFRRWRCRSTGSRFCVRFPLSAESR